jgi:hypothetical protein
MMNMKLQVLLVEDDSGDLKSLEQSLPSVFEENKIEVTVHGCGDFTEAFELAADPLRRYDLIISDTYRGPTKNGDAEVLKMVDTYRGSKFCPLVVYSSGVKPPNLEESQFVLWADKGKPGDIERALTEMLKTGVPQIARKLHDELEQSAASFLWPFLEKNWPSLLKAAGSDTSLIERLIRRRAAIQIGDLEYDGKKLIPVLRRCGSEYYVYPRLARDYYSLGDLLRHKKHPAEFRIVMTPHCHLFPQRGNPPRADYVLTIKTVSADTVLGEKLAAVKGEEKAAKQKKLGQWTRSPAQTHKLPEGRHWYLPGFLEIPHLFCDFLQMESIPYSQVSSDFEAIATLVPPYAEALQACFVAFYGSVGIPVLNPESIESLLDEK